MLFSMVIERAIRVVFDDGQSRLLAGGDERLAARQRQGAASWILESRVRAVLAGWGVSVVPRLLAEGLLQQGLLRNVAPACAVPVQLYWHCWNLQSEVLDALTNALSDAAARALVA